ncbi:rhodanese-like domain-containing protein [Zunongwangia sp. HGR-M22]|uniref:rhodanese-like domain-containing protein n=1 Tax=Zunongwangia sp. HGR-M22 TaxID=3015168 RepID=UPI0022DDE9A9|nr:rhodanese-like domain-containing protein [Zunongwangia sp. HGR-M22]WBL26343.1 rhodanese-like domain-containing protein [Zunongwangia sp. HGR-M22]
MKRLFFAVILLFLSLQSCKELEASEIDMISAEEMLERLDEEEFQVLDVRPEEEFADAHILRAKNIILNENNDNSLFFDTLSKDKPVVIYGENKEHTKKAIDILKKDGFSEVYELEGGIQDWILLGGEVH